MGSAQLVACRIAGSEYAIHISAVREIIRDEGGAVPVGGGDPTMLGVVDLRGTAMPVLDLARTLRMRRDEGESVATEEARRIIVTAREGDGDGEVVGWLVDGVDEVITVDGDHFQELDQGAATDVVRQVARTDGGRLLPVLDVDLLLAWRERDRAGEGDATADGGWAVAA